MPGTRPTESGRIRLAIGETEGISKTGVREILSRQEGLAPVRVSQARKPVRALFKRTYFCRTSDRSPVFFAGPRCRAHDPGIRGREDSLFRDEAPRPTESGGNGAQASAIVKWRQPFTTLKRSEEPETNEERRKCHRGSEVRGSSRPSAQSCRNSRLQLLTKRSFGEFLLTPCVGPKIAWVAGTDPRLT